MSQKPTHVWAIDMACVNFPKKKNWNKYLTYQIIQQCLFYERLFNASMLNQIKTKSFFLPPKKLKMSGDATVQPYTLLK